MGDPYSLYSLSYILKCIAGAIIMSQETEYLTTTAQTGHPLPAI